MNQLKQIFSKRNSFYQISNSVHAESSTTSDSVLASINVLDAALAQPLCELLLPKELQG